MIFFLVSALRLLRAVIRGIRKDHEFRALLGLFVVTLMSGTIFYTTTEKWGIIDSLYFCVMTMSTIGYGDFTPSTPASKLFTILFALGGIGVFAAMVSKIVAIVLERQKAKVHRRPHLKKHRNPDALEESPKPKARSKSRPEPKLKKAEDAPGRSNTGSRPKPRKVPDTQHRPARSEPPSKPKHPG